MMCRILARLIGPLRRDSLQAELGIGVDQSYSPTRGRWDPVFLSEKWQDGRGGQRGSGLSRQGPPPTSNRCRMRLKTCNMGAPMQRNAVGF